MSNDTNTPIEDLKYKELQTLCKEKQLGASGTKAELVARLTEANGAKTPATESAPEASEQNDAAPEKEAATEENKAPDAPPERMKQKKADHELKTDAAKMKKHLDGQKKVSIMIPFEVGENPENGKKVKFHVNLNGYAVDIPRGVYVEEPQQVADIIKERLESEGKIGNEWRLDRDPKKMEALG